MIKMLVAEFDGRGRFAAICHLNEAMMCVTMLNMAMAILILDPAAMQHSYTLRALERLSINKWIGILPLVGGFSYMLGLIMTWRRLYDHSSSSCVEIGGRCLGAVIFGAIFAWGLFVQTVNWPETSLFYWLFIWMCGAAVRSGWLAAQRR